MCAAAAVFCATVIAVALIGLVAAGVFVCVAGAIAALAARELRLADERREAQRELSSQFDWDWPTP